MATKVTMKAVVWSFESESLEIRHRPPHDVSASKDEGLSFNRDVNCIQPKDVVGNHSREHKT